ncbi:MAG: GT4 family glycosyltransferase PelF [Propionibacteriales bacterium]|nr:GT4 family glycosyltransferase PelF [Propionibacteriales bacterium]
MSDVCLHLEGRYPGGGGVVTWIDSLVRQLPAVSFTVVAFTHPRCGAAPTEAAPPSNVDEVVEILLPDGDPAALPAGDVDILAAAVPDAAVHHVLSVGVASRVAARATSLQGRPFLLTEHGIAWREKTLGQLMADSITARAARSNAALSAAVDAYRDAAAVTSVSRTGAAWQRALGAPASRVLQVANPVPQPRRPAKPSVVSDDSGPLIGLVARVVMLKDIATFVRAAALVARECPTARFVVLGALHEDEDYVQRCLDLARSVGLGGRLTFAGEVDAWAWYPSLDVVVLTSRSEAQPFAVLEALSAGRPVVSTAAGDVPHLLAGADPAGVVVPIADAHAVADGVLRALVADPVDIAAAARRIVDRFPSEAQQATTYARLYDWAVEGNTIIVPAACVGTDRSRRGQS